MMLLSWLLLPLAEPSRAGDQSDLDAIWNDPFFKQQFIGSYGITEIEPRVTPDEVAILEKLRPLMASDLPGAEDALRRQLRPDCSATPDFYPGWHSVPAGQAGRSARQLWARPWRSFPASAAPGATSADRRAHGQVRCSQSMPSRG
ncbi:MAG: hypothetical protein U1E76_21670 [Planctomycetota bacterium]